MQIARWKTITAVAGAIVLVLIVVAGFRIYGFLTAVGVSVNPGNIISTTVGKDNNPNDVLYKIQHKQQINILLLGYSGPGWNGPYLTDSMLVLSINPATDQAVLVSVPRDLYVKIYALANGGYVWEKVNAAYAMGVQGGWGQMLAPYTGRYGGGNLAMATVSSVTGLKIDYYLAVDWHAFVTVVNDLGGVNICLSTRLDDFQYPLPNGHLVPGGIHFPAGCQHVNGAQALELARSRHAVEPQQATDFARATRQRQLLLSAKSEAESLNFLIQIPKLMGQMQTQFSTDLTLSDINALWDYASHMHKDAVHQLALTNQNFLMDSTCPQIGAYILCPVARNFQQIHALMGDMFPPPPVQTDPVPVQIYNASQVYYFDVIWSAQLSGLGLDAKAAGSYPKEVAQTVIYNYGRGSSDSSTANYLAQLFGAQVVQEAYNPSKAAMVVVLGTDQGALWNGQGQVDYYANIQPAGSIGP